MCMNWDSLWYPFFDISWWYHHTWCILYTCKVIKGNACVYYQDRLVLPVLLFYIGELRRDGLWTCPQLSSYSWWGCEYNMYRCWQNYTFNLWEKLMYLSYTTEWLGSSVGHPEGALALFCLWVLSYAYGMRCQDDVTSRRVFTHPMCMPICWTGHFNSCMFMINYCS